jgi:hypothetical protein
VGLVAMSVAAGCAIVAGSAPSGAVTRRAASHRQQRHPLANPGAAGPGARPAVPGGVDLLWDGAGGQTRDQAVGAVREGGRAIFLGPPLGPPAQLERGITSESFSAHGNRQRLEALGRLVEAGKLRPQILEPLWIRFAALLGVPPRPPSAGLPPPTHPDRLVFDKLVPGPRIAVR